MNFVIPALQGTVAFRYFCMCYIITFSYSKYVFDTHCKKSH